MDSRLHGNGKLSFSEVSIYRTPMGLKKIKIFFIHLKQIKGVHYESF